VALQPIALAACQMDEYVTPLIVTGVLTLV
jgi:hypothetical protein